MYNNTNEDLVVVAINAKSQETRRLLKKGQAGPVGRSSKMRIERGGRHWTYYPKEIPSEFQKRKNSMISIINLQIEEDGTIYVLPPGTQGPVTSFPPQPSGYPLRPY